MQDASVKDKSNYFLNFLEIVNQFQKQKFKVKKIWFIFSIILKLSGLRSSRNKRHDVT